MTFPFVTLGFLTFTAKRWAQNPTITLVDGGTAGFETVTMDASLNIRITIQSGTSTNLQIKNAILATPTPSSGFGVNDMVTVTITTGHNSDTQVAGISAPTTGGLTASTKAFVVIGALKFTAHTAGVGGNSLSVKFTSGATAGSEVVTDPNSNGNPLQVQIQDASSVSYVPLGGNPSGNSDYSGVPGSTAAQVKAAVDAWQLANTVYFDVSFVGGENTPMSVSSASVATFLSGGAAVAPAAVTLQGVTATSLTNNSTQNGLALLSFIGGGTAGAEVVTDNPDGTFTVHIQSGTSTPTQIATALNTDGGFAAFWAATFSGSTAVKANDLLTMSGAVGPNPDIPRMSFYADQSTVTLTTSYQYLPFNNVMQEIILSNDDATGSNKLSYSWDGVNVSGIVFPASNFSFEKINKSGIYVKYVNGSPAFRIMADSAR